MMTTRMNWNLCVKLTMTSMTIPLNLCVKLTMTSMTIPLNLCVKLTMTSMTIPTQMSLKTNRKLNCQFNLVTVERLLTLLTLCSLLLDYYVIRPILFYYIFDCPNPASGLQYRNKRIVSYLAHRNIISLIHCFRKFSTGDNQTIL